MAIVDDHMKAYERELVRDEDLMFGMFKAARQDIPKPDETPLDNGHPDR